MRILTNNREFVSITYIRYLRIFSNLDRYTLYRVNIVQVHAHIHTAIFVLTQEPLRIYKYMHTAIFVLTQEPLRHSWRYRSLPLPYELCKIWSSRRTRSEVRVGQRLTLCLWLFQCAVFNTCV